MLPTDPIVTDMHFFGVRGRAARRMVRRLRGPVTATVCRLLPGADRETGMRWLFATENTLMAMVKEITGRLHPRIPEEQLHAAAFAVGLLYPITDELRRRHDEVETPLSHRPPSATAPVPSAELIALRATAEELAAATLTPYVPRERWLRSRQAPAAPIRELVGDDTDLPWGAWTTFAAVMALHLHRDDLPDPGRDAPSGRPGPASGRAADAGVAFQVGRMLLIEFVLGLLDLADRPGTGSG